MNHMPWDNGALRLLGELVQQKTIKARCGKRVAFATADEREPVTCPDCNADIKREADFVADMRARYPEFAR